MSSVANRSGFADAGEGVCLVIVDALSVSMAESWLLTTGLRLRMRDASDTVPCEA